MPGLHERPERYAQRIYLADLLSNAGTRLSSLGLNSIRPYGHSHRILLPPDLPIAAHSEVRLMASQSSTRLRLVALAPAGDPQESEALLELLRQRYADVLTAQLPAGTNVRWHARNRADVIDFAALQLDNGGHATGNPAAAATWVVACCRAWLGALRADPISRGWLPCPPPVPPPSVPAHGSRPGAGSGNLGRAQSQPVRQSTPVPRAPGMTSWLGRRHRYLEVLLTSEAATLIARRSQAASPATTVPQAALGEGDARDRRLGGLCWRGAGSPDPGAMLVVRQLATGSFFYGLAERPVGRWRAIMAAMSRPGRPLRLSGQGTAWTSWGGVDFLLSAEQRELTEAAAAFARRELNQDLVKREDAGEFPREAWRMCAKFGVQGLPVPAELGGAGADVLTTALVMEALGYGCQDNGAPLFPQRCGQVVRSEACDQ